MIFPKTQVDRFYKEFWPERKGQQRLGQAFYDYMKLEKIQNDADKFFCDRLYATDAGVAEAMIKEMTDYNN